MGLNFEFPTPFSGASGYFVGLSLIVGLYKIVQFSLSLGSLFLSLFVLPPVNFAKYGAKKGTWAVITGASDGIGKEYSIQLAKKGFNIVLVSRTQSKLEVLSKEIESKYNVETKVLAFDASSDSDENYSALQATVSNIPVTILINNVGQSHSIPVPFLETQEKELRDIVTINNLATLRITQIVTPVIVKTAKEIKKRGLILTMGSFAGLLPTPYLSVYSGSKAFLQNWSSALAGELKQDNVDVELVVSYLVTSAMSKIRRSSWTIPTPKAFVASTLRNVGRRVGAQERFGTITPYSAHAIMHFAIDNAVGVYSAVANKLNKNMHEDIRRRALAKARRVAAAAASEKK